MRLLQLADAQVGGVGGQAANTVKVAYIDTELGPTPAQAGQISGTPTIKAFVPKRTSGRNEKTVVDYDQVPLTPPDMEAVPPNAALAVAGLTSWSNLAPT